MQDAAHEGGILDDHLIGAVEDRDLAELGVVDAEHHWFVADIHAGVSEPFGGIDHSG